MKSEVTVKFYAQKAKTIPAQSRDDLEYTICIMTTMLTLSEVHHKKRQSPLYALWSSTTSSCLQS